MHWVIVDVGCIECGSPTVLRGVYHDEESARTDYNKIVKETPWGSDYSLDLFCVKDNTEETGHAESTYFS